MATRLFYYQFFGDLGKRFLTSILVTLLEEFVGLDHSVEIDSGRVGPSPKPVDTDANLKWILVKLTEFVGRLRDSPDHCPLGLRESFLFLKDVVGNKVENSNVFIAISPEEYGVLDSLGLTLTEHGKRGLIIASKILQSAANNSPWENRPGSEQVNAFITQSNALIVKFASQLIVFLLVIQANYVQDTEVISLGKKVIKASVTPVTATEIKQTHDDMRHFIAHFILHKQIKAEVDYQQKYQLAMSLYNSTEWKIAASGPKKDGCEYFVSQTKQEGSNIFICRYWGRFKAKYELVKEYIREHNPEMTIDDRVVSNEMIQKHNENYFDGYLTIKAMFPIAARDFVFTRKNWEESLNKWMQITYSIDREDRPVVKKFIRGHMELLLSVIERDPSDLEYTLYTYIYHVDLKGWVPAFLVNNASKDNLITLGKIGQKVMQLGKEPANDEKKQKKEKKSKKEKN